MRGNKKNVLTVLILPKLLICVQNTAQVIGEDLALSA